MVPVINDTSFGSITVDGMVFDHDIIITLEGKVKKRKKKLSKAVYGTSHTISLEEAEYVFQKGSEGIIIGSGQYGVVELSKEAAGFLKQKNCEVRLFSTPDAIREWNIAEGKWIDELDNSNIQKIYEDAMMFEKQIHSGEVDSTPQRDDEKVSVQGNAAQADTDLPF